jgi:hypothetical protein
LPGEYLTQCAEEFAGLKMRLGVGAMGDHPARAHGDELHAGSARNSSVNQLLGVTLCAVRGMFSASRPTRAQGQRLVWLPLDALSLDEAVTQLSVRTPDAYSLLSCHRLLWEKEDSKTLEPKPGAGCTHRRTNCFQTIKGSYHALVHA